MSQDKAQAQEQAPKQQQPAAKPQQVRPLDEGKKALAHGLSTIGNTFRLTDHVTGILADKAERYREQVAISDAIAHNELMAEYRDQATKLGLDF